MMNTIEMMKQNQEYYSNNKDMPSELQKKAKFCAGNIIKQALWRKISDSLCCKNFSVNVIH